MSHVTQESLQHGIKTLENQHTESVTNVKKQVCFYGYIFIWKHKVLQPIKNFNCHLSSVLKFQAKIRNIEEEKVGNARIHSSHFHNLGPLE